MSEKVIQAMCHVVVRNVEQQGSAKEFIRAGLLKDEYRTLSEQTFEAFVQMLGEFGAVSDYVAGVYKFIADYGHIKKGNNDSKIVQHVKQICKQCVIAGCLKCATVCFFPKNEINSPNFRFTRQYSTIRC